MIAGLTYKISQYLNLVRHRRDWRKMNSHNMTVASNFFPKHKVKVGINSYGDLHIISYGEENEGLEIGSYVSIANDVKFLLGGNHFYKRFTTYPFIAKFVDTNYVETWTKGKIEIGDDVWIGTEAFILPGVTVGKGAIIAARAVVSKDIPAYSIVAGNPATVVKLRFPTEIIKKLEVIDFSKIDPDLIIRNIEHYKSESSFDAILKLLEKNI